MIKKKKKYFKSLSNFKENYKYKFNKFLDLTIIDDDKINSLKSSLKFGQKKLKGFLNIKIIEPIQTKILNQKISFFYIEKIITKFQKFKDLKIYNSKFNIFNSLRKFRDIKSLIRINKSKNILKSKISNKKIVVKRNLIKKFFLTNKLTKFHLSKKNLSIIINKQIKEFNFLSKFIKQNPIKISEVPEYVATLLYCDHFLFIAKIWKSKENILNVEKLIELPVPASVIGDDLVTNVDELMELSLDSFEVLDLKNPPILIVLSSSFFTIRSIKENNKKEISEHEELILSKSPYLPQDTLIDIEKFNENTHNIIFVRKSLINGWVNTLKKINCPVIGITTLVPHQIEILRENKKLISELEIITDIELNSTTIFTFSRGYELSSQKIPYGASLYRKKELYESYFSRLIKSIRLITNDLKMNFPERIYVTGFGLDYFDYLPEKLPYPFIRFSELNKVKYKFNRDQSVDLLNKNLDSKLNIILGITSKCL